MKTRDGWAGVGGHPSHPAASTARRTSLARYRRCPPNVFTAVSFPALAHRVTVFGDTPTRRATSAGVSIGSGLGAVTCRPSQRHAASRGWPGRRGTPSNRRTPVRAHLHEPRSSPGGGPPPRAGPRRGRPGSGTCWVGSGACGERRPNRPPPQPFRSGGGVRAPAGGTGTLTLDAGGSRPGWGTFRPVAPRTRGSTRLAHPAGSQSGRSG